MRIFKEELRADISISSNSSVVDVGDADLTCEELGLPGERMPAAVLNKRIAVAVDETDLISEKMSKDIRDQSAIALLPRLKSLPTPDNNDPIIDRFISLAKRLFQVPIALVTIADIDCSWFKANTGLEGAIEVIQEASFCACKSLI